MLMNQHIRVWWRRGESNSREKAKEALKNKGYRKCVLHFVLHVTIKDVGFVA